jgi:hypothetical protein
MDNFDLKKFITEGKLLKENIEQDILNFWGTQLDDAAQSDGEYGAEWDTDFFIDNYPKYKGREEEIDSLTKKLKINSELNEGRYTDEGYVQMMGPEFADAVKVIEKAWFEWKSAPMTNPKMKIPAKQDLLNYFDMILD